MHECLRSSLETETPKGALLSAYKSMKQIHIDGNNSLLGSSTAVCLRIDKENQTYVTMSTIRTLSIFSCILFLV